jgi:hypothetical protein
MFSNNFPVNSRKLSPNRIARPTLLVPLLITTVIKASRWSTSPVSALPVRRFFQTLKRT